ncbi:MAG TPA: ammonium transporter, partial [Steroidobacteraceae bacterium]|nr:ammonium transporter [Steroidobacteraceae bacterium]
MLTAPMTSQPTRKPQWLAQAGTPLRSLFRAVTGRSALLMALATVTFAAVSFTPAASYADASSAPATSAPAPAAAAAAPAAATAVPASSAPAAPAPTPNKGDMAWMLTSTALVLFMSVPALALFYGGLVREKNMLSVLMQVFVGFSLITVLWCVYGYTLAFTQGSGWTSPFIGGFSRLFLNGTFDPATGNYSTAATFDKGTPLVELVYVGFQATFAAITCCLILGSLVERVKFSAALVFMIIWFTFAYLPVAHMVWFWQGPDAYTAANVVDTVNSQAGYIWQMGALDFAGGTVVHINSGVAGLVGAILLGKRIGLGKESMAPHSLTMTMIGASMLWFGWFGFNAGSALEANGSAALAFMNTYLATACAVLSWMGVEWLVKGKPSMLGAASGAVAGLVAITPAAGNVGIPGAFIIGLGVGVVCFWGVTGLKKMIRADDALDVFGVHALGGTFGALTTGIFNAPSLGGPGSYDNWFSMKQGYPGIWHQFLIQLKAVCIVIVWTAVVAFIAFGVLKFIMGIRVSEEEEREGLDISSHGERAYG